MGTNPFEVDDDSDSSDRVDDDADDDRKSQNADCFESCMK